MEFSNTMLRDILLATDEKKWNSDVWEIKSTNAWVIWSKKNWENWTTIIWKIQTTKPCDNQTILLTNFPIITFLYYI